MGQSVAMGPPILILRVLPVAPGLSPDVKEMERPLSGADDTPLGVEAGVSLLVFLSISDGGAETKWGRWTLCVQMGPPTEYPAVENRQAQVSMCIVDTRMSLKGASKC